MTTCEKCCINFQVLISRVKNFIEILRKFEIIQTFQMSLNSCQNSLEIVSHAVIAPISVW